LKIVIVFVVMCTVLCQAVKQTLLVWPTTSTHVHLSSMAKEHGLYSPITSVISVSLAITIAVFVPRDTMPAPYILWLHNCLSVCLPQAAACDRQIDRQSFTNCKTSDVMFRTAVQQLTRFQLT